MLTGNSSSQQSAVNDQLQSKATPRSQASARGFSWKRFRAF